jgi:hypothetical protein
MVVTGTDVGLSSEATVMKCTNSFAAGLVLLLAAGFAHRAAAQDFGFMSYYEPWYGGYGFGGTVEGDYLWGMSEVIRAAGEYNLNTAKAGVNNEEARRRYLENKKKWTTNYYQLREQRQAQDAQKRERQRASRQTYYASLAAAPSRAPAPEALDPVTGRISWPDVLLGGEFETPRKEIDQLFELRARTSQGAGNTLRLRELTQEMSRILRSQVAKIPANDYMAARKFIDKLDYSARSGTI